MSLSTEEPCRNGLPTDRTSWDKLQKPLSAAIKSFVEHCSNQKLLIMQANEVSITGELKRSIEEQLDRIYASRLWDVTPEHTRVLSQGQVKKQPSQYLLEAIPYFWSVRNDAPSEFQAYLQQFAPDDFTKAETEIKRKSTKIKGDTITKVRTKPDIIVHELTCPRIEHNLIAIEFKPDWSKELHLSLEDLARMKAFTMSKEPPDDKVLPTYQHSLFLYLSSNNRFRGWRFENGVQEPFPFTIS